MIHRIEIENNGETEILHETDCNSERRVSACKFTDDLSAVPSAEIVVTPANPAFDRLHELTTLIKIIDTKRNKTVFDGRILQISDCGMNSSGTVSKKIICEGAMGYLCDTVQLYHHYAENEVTAFLASLLDYHNYIMSWHSPERCIFLGAVDVHGTSSKTTAQRSTMDEIKENLISRLGGVMRVRRNEQNQLVLDYWQEESYGEICDTKVELAWNMKSISSGTDATGVITRLYPFGSQLDAETGERLTISSVNYGCPYLDDEGAVQKYGVKCGSYVWDDVTLPENLLSRGREYLQQVTKIRKSYKATVLDLSLLEKDADSFEVGNTYRFVNSLLNLDEYLKIIKITTDIFKPYQPVIEIGDKLERITNIASQTRNYVEYEIPKQKSEILQQAKDNASALITSATHGYVVVEPEEILIMNTDSKDTATKVWRWNINGLGYSHSDTPGQAYDGEYGLAMTMDGAIVADYITAGTMYADRIRGGTLIVGGGDGQNGSIEVRNSANSAICTFNENGADVFGKITSRDSSGYWVTVNSGQVQGGNGNSTYMIIDARGTITDTSGTVHRGVRIRADAVSLDNCSHFGISGYEGCTGGFSYDRVESDYSSQEVVTDIWIDENGELQKTTETIRYVSRCDVTTYGSINFRSGIMVTELD